MSIHLGTPRFSIPVLIVCAAGIAAPQSLMRSSGSGGVRIYSTDSAVLESRDPRQDLPCVVNPVKPFVGFDLKFHSGYEIVIPLKELSGNEDLLTIVFRVTPDQPDALPSFFSQRITVPAIEEEAKGSAYLQGSFDLGEGKYKIDLLIRDRAERVCSHYWDSEAVLPPKDKDLGMTMEPMTVAASEREPFKEEPPIDRTPEDGLNVKILVNFAPQNSNAASMQPTDTNALVSILRNIAREPRIGKFSVVAFNMQEQRVLYRQDTSGQIDFPSLGDAVDKLKLGVIDLKKLADKHGDTRFLTDLISQEMSAETPDALIFAGPKVMLEQEVPETTLKQLGDPRYPVFYMNYNFNPQVNPWRDAIGNTVKFFKGQEYTISRPRDLWFAWTEIMSRIVKSKGGRADSGPASR